MIEFFVATYDQKERLFIKYPQNATIHAVLKDFTGSKWSHSKKCWHFELNRTLANLLYKKLKEFGPVETRNLKEWSLLSIYIGVGFKGSAGKPLLRKA